MRRILPLIWWSVVTGGRGERRSCNLILFRSIPCYHIFENYMLKQYFQTLYSKHCATGTCNRCSEPLQCTTALLGSDINKCNQNVFSWKYFQMSFDSPSPSIRSIRSIRIQHRMSVLQVKIILITIHQDCRHRCVDNNVNWSRSIASNNADRPKSTRSTSKRATALLSR